MTKPLYIVVEGIDGVGKSTLMNDLKVRVEKHKIDSFLTKEPTDGRYGQEIRRRAREGSMTSREELELFIKDRREHMVQIKKSQDAGQLIIQDRCFVSTAAYQASHSDNDCSVQEIIDLNNFAIIPDILIILDMCPEEALSRTSNREAKECFEDLDRLTRCREVYLELAKKMNSRKCRVCVFSANFNKDIIAHTVWELIKSNLA